MRQSSLLAILLGGMLLTNGCTVSQENFKKDTDAFVQKEGATLPQFSKEPGYNEKRGKQVQNLLRDDLVRQAIYQDAVEAGTSWSSRAILEGNWFEKFSRRGMSRLPLGDKQYLAGLLRDIVTLVPTKDCASLKGQVKLSPTTIPAFQIDHFLEVQERAVKLGSANISKSNSYTETEKIVAIAAFFAKAKEKYSDQELVELLTPVIEKNKATMCKSLPPLTNLFLELDPKYQQILFDDIIKY